MYVYALDWVTNAISVFFRARTMDVSCVCKHCLWMDNLGMRRGNISETFVVWICSCPPLYITLFVPNIIFSLSDYCHWTMPINSSNIAVLNMSLRPQWRACLLTKVMLNTDKSSLSMSFFVWNFNVDVCILKWTGNPLLCPLLFGEKKKGPVNSADLQNKVDLVQC